MLKCAASQVNVIVLAVNLTGCHMINHMQRRLMGVLMLQIYLREVKKIKQNSRSWICNAIISKKYK